MGVPFINIVGVPLTPAFLPAAVSLATSWLYLLLSKHWLKALASSPKLAANCFWWSAVAQPVFSWP